MNGRPAKERPELDLLVDLAKLIRKHGPESFEILANSIGSTDFARELADLLSASARISRATPYRGKVTKKTITSTEKTLALLQETDPKKYELVTDFYHALQSKSVLPTIRDVKAFALDCGLTEIRENSRQKSIVPLMKRLILLPTEELRDRLKMLQWSQKGDRSLEGWTNIILGPKKEDE